MDALENRFSWRRNISRPSNESRRKTRLLGKVKALMFLSFLASIFALLAGRYSLKPTRGKSSRVNLLCCMISAFIGSLLVPCTTKTSSPLVVSLAQTSRCLNFWDVGETKTVATSTGTCTLTGLFLPDSSLYVKSYSTQLLSLPSVTRY
jgi:hypothetical protein